VSERREAEGRQLWAGLNLLDRQLVARDGRLAGCVDDLELAASDDGDELHITAILSGPGALAYRFGRRRLGRWLRRANDRIAGHVREDPTRIPFNLVTDIDSHIGIALGEDEVGIATLENWVCEHIVSRVPGSRHEPE
jgi:hypothetical protein